MKTQKDKLRHVVKSTGGCWHKYGALSLTNAHGLMCEHCSAITGVNPSPTDLNELFRLSMKTGYKVIEFYCEDPTSDLCCIRHYEHEAEFEEKSFTPAEALLNALYTATGGKE